MQQDTLPVQMSTMPRTGWADEEAANMAQRSVWLPGSQSSAG